MLSQNLMWAGTEISSLGLLAEPDFVACQNYCYAQLMTKYEFHHSGAHQAMSRYFIIPLPHSTLLSHIFPASKLTDVLKTQILHFHAMFLYATNACRIVDLCREVFSYLKGVQPNPTPFPFSRVTINQLLLFYLSFIHPPSKAPTISGSASNHHSSRSPKKSISSGVSVRFSTNM